MRGRDGRQARWLAAAASQRRWTLALSAVLIIWLMFVVRYYYRYGAGTLPNGPNHQHVTSPGLDPHPPHHDRASTHMPSTDPSQPNTDIISSDDDDNDSSASSTHSSESPSSSPNPHNSQSSTSSESSSSSNDNSEMESAGDNGNDGQHNKYGSIVPMKQRQHRMASPAIVIVAHDRDANIRALYQSLSTQPHINNFQIYISCDLPSAEPKIKAALPADANVQYWWHQPFGASGQFAEWQRSGLFRISYHFKMALSKVFDEHHHSHAILIEEDLLVAPDFLQLFIDTAWLLDEDPSLYCISAWNDNGFKPLVSDKQRLFRTGYFPGLGWMIKQDMWNDHLRANWPPAATTGWDHWLRLSSISQYRDCISPEIPRTQHTSESGINVNSASAALFAKYAFSDRQPSHDGTSYGDTSLMLKQPYEDSMKKLVSSATRITDLHSINANTAAGVYLLPYREEQYHQLATTLGLWPDHGARGWYQGIITTRSPSRPEITILLAERRRARPFLRSDESIVPLKDTILVAANGGENCVSACARAAVTANMKHKPKTTTPTARQWRCFDSEIAFVNNCESLLRVFACEAGCGHQIGGELPAYVIDSTERTHHQCLVTDGANSCASAHAATRRVCPCNPAD